MVSELDRAPLIRVQVDQEVFLAAVLAGDQMEEATVATEVTLFERVGDAYVLEGAILFAGFARRAGAVDSLGDSRDVLAAGFADGGVGAHFQHRLPFVLRVPVQQQPRGIVNVTSRISSWTLNVVEANWLRMIADLQLVGLSGDRGYHFECGSQEEGDLFFHAVDSGPRRDSAPPAAVELPDSEELAEARATDTSDKSGDLAPATDIADTDRSEDLPMADGAVVDLQWVRGLSKPAGSADESDNAASNRHAVGDQQVQMNQLSEARGGVPAVPAQADVASPPPTDKPSASTATQQELANLDRRFRGEDQAEATAVADTTATKNQAAQVDASTNPVSDAQSRQTHWAEFDVEHQVSALEAQPTADDAGAAGPFRASRSFAGAQFSAAEGFADATGRGTTQRGAGATDDNSGGDGGRRPSQHVAASDDDDVLLRTTGPLDEHLWSFVDFRGPDVRHTLRFVVVLDEETLDGVADRTGCARSALMQANRLSSDMVVPGQALLLPAGVAGRAEFD